MLSLASGAVAQFAVERLLSADLVLDFATVAGCLVAGFKVLVGVVKTVGCFSFPVIDTGGVLLGFLLGAHLGGVCAGCCGGGLVGTVRSYRC
jgi:hypothetical protein